MDADYYWVRFHDSNELTVVQRLYYKDRATGQWCSEYLCFGDEQFYHETDFEIIDVIERPQGYLYNTEYEPSKRLDNKRTGTWWVRSKTDSRWDADGNYSGALFNAYKNTDGWIRYCKYRFGDAPEDLIAGYMKD